MAEAEEGLGDYEAVLTHLARARPISVRWTGESSDEVEGIDARRAEAELALDRLDAARETAAATLDRRGDDAAPTFWRARLFDVVGVATLQLDDAPETATRSLRSALAIRRSGFGHDHLAIGVTECRLAAALLREGRYAEGLEAATRAAAALDARDDGAATDYRTTANFNAGVALSHLGRTQEAVAALRGVAAERRTTISLDDELAARADAEAEALETGSA